MTKTNKTNTPDAPSPQERAGERSKDISQLQEYKRKTLEKTQNPIAVKAIQFELKKLENISAHIDSLNEMIENLKSYSRNLEQAKAIAEMVCLIHGIPDTEIQTYYNSGLEYTLSKLEDLTEENQIIIPAGLKKYLKK